MAGRGARTGAPAALVLLWAYASQLVHLVGASHEICPADGEVVELTESSPPATIALAPSDAAFAPGETARPRHHDQCLTAFGDDEGALPDAASPGPDRPLTPSALAPFTARPLPPRLQLFRLAPKNSPPA